MLAYANACVVLQFTPFGNFVFASSAIDLLNARYRPFDGLYFLAIAIRSDVLPPSQLPATELTLINS